jgi:acyl carrier protein
MRDDLVALIIERAREMLESTGGANGPVDADSRLFGKGGLFDSMGLVSLVVAVEQEIDDRFGVAVALADEKALSRSSSPYHTIATLAEYAAERIGAGG